VLPLTGPAIPVIPNTDGAMSFFVSILAGLRSARPDIDVNAYLTRWAAPCSMTSAPSAWTESSIACKASASVSC
jgi:hypothetical protein